MESFEHWTVVELKNYLLQHDISMKDIEGSGKNGNVIKKDLIKAVKKIHRKSSYINYSPIKTFIKSPRKSGGQITNFPDEMIMELLNNMSLPEFIDFCSTNKKYHNICKNEQYWKRYYEQFNIDLKSKFPDLSYMRLVQILYNIKQILDVAKIRKVAFENKTPIQKYLNKYFKMYDFRGDFTCDVKVEGYIVSKSNKTNDWYVDVVGVDKRSKSDVELMYRGTYIDIVNLLADLIYNNVLGEYDL